jgi:hypothetical protein
MDVLRKVVTDDLADALIPRARGTFGPTRSREFAGIVNGVILRPPIGPADGHRVLAALSRVRAIAALSCR